MLVMSTFHGFAGFVWATGVNQDVEHQPLQPGSNRDYHTLANSSEEDLSCMSPVVYCQPKMCGAASPHASYNVCRCLSDLPGFYFHPT